ncbi:hypothetical protein [Luteolibacter sp. LG18]|uniref:hypothetical protein n=1 Tax=Luteolibacter sp. LG18 TaxID=2819286 RepID=UPI0030C708A1
MMRNYRKTIGALAAASALVAGYASAEVEGELHIGYSSDYIFRGSDQGDGLAEAGADVSTQYAGLTFSGGLWYGSIENSDLFNFGPIGIPDHYSELDVYGEVSKDFGFATAYVGAIWYHYADNDIATPFGDIKLRDDSSELYFGLSREIYWGINGSLTYYWALEGENGGYTELALDKTFKLHDCVDLVAGVKTGYFIEESGFAHITPQLTLNVKVTDTFTVSPYVAYSIEGDELATVYGNNKIQAVANALSGGNFPPSETNHFYGGVKLSVKF